MAIAPYLADVYAAYTGQGAYALAPPPDPDPGQMVSAPAPVMSVAPPPEPVVGPMPPPAPPPVAPPPPPSPGEDPNALVSRAPPPVSQGPAPIDVGAEPAPAAPTPGPDPHAFDLQAVPGGGSPAHEVEMRGPSLLAAQGQRNEAVAGAIGAVAGRNADAADEELQMALSQERSARIREAAFQQSIAEQEDELAARQADFDSTAQQMGRLGKLNPGRHWASLSTGQKIAGMIEIGLAGFRNAPSVVMKRIDDDIKAQEFAYMAARDQTNAKQTAFGSAMAKYQNANAARLAARTASLDIVSAQLNEIAAKNKGNATGNAAISALAELQNERMLMIQQGIKFVPAMAGGRYFVNPRTGVVYNNKEAMAYDKEQRDRWQQDRQEAGKVGGQIAIETIKGEAEARKERAKGGDTRVRLPNGDIIVAPSPTEATALRSLSVAVSNANQLVDQARKIRSQTGWYANPGALKELDRIQAELTLAFKDRGGLGALSGPDMDLALAGTSNIKGWGPGVDNSLNGFQLTTQRALQNRVKTLPDAPSSAGGELSAEAKKSLGGYSK